jgi:hypothetical protein
LQTTIHYNIDASGRARTTFVEGMFKSEGEAKKAAKALLLDGTVTKGDSVQFNIYGGQDEWGNDEDVVVHAVGINGENILIGSTKN